MEDIIFNVILCNCAGGRKVSWITFLGSLKPCVTHFWHKETNLPSLPTLLLPTCFLYIYTSENYYWFISGGASSRSCILWCPYVLVLVYFLCLSCNMPMQMRFHYVSFWKLGLVILLSFIFLDFMH